VRNFGFIVSLKIWTENENFQSLTLKPKPQVKVLKLAFKLFLPQLIMGGIVSNPLIEATMFVQSSLFK
jgi:hypothetical protein